MGHAGAVPRKLRPLRQILRGLILARLALPGLIFPLVLRAIVLRHQILGRRKCLGESPACPKV